MGAPSHAATSLTALTATVVTATTPLSSSAHEKTPPTMARCVMSTIVALNRQSSRPPRVIRIACRSHLDASSMMALRRSRGSHLAGIPWLEGPGPHLIE